MKPRLIIDLNCDMGELPELLANGTEEKIMQVITSANIACGGHAGDEHSMRELVKLAKKYEVNIGAHPGYPDRENFGRKRLDTPPEEVEKFCYEQIARLARVSEELGGKLHHIKPHGALYHAAQDDHEIARAVANATARVNKNLILVEQAGDPVLDLWRAMGFRVWAEAFADRAYEETGKLRDRSLPGAVLTQAETTAQQAVEIAVKRTAASVTGRRIDIEADSICLHGDGPSALPSVLAVHSALKSSAANPPHLDFKNI